MARTRKEPVPLTVEQQKDLAAIEFNGWNSTPRHLLPPPTRHFEVGEEVRIGNLKEVFIDEVFEGGMYYLYHCTWSTRDVAPHISYRCAMWFDIKKLSSYDTTVPRLFSTYQRHPALNTSLDGIIHYLHSGGIVCDPLYQRDYVWSEDNKDQLIESVFDRLDIGSFLFVRHAGYNHEGDVTTKTYHTLMGTDVVIPRQDDYTVSIIDGQQRLTTLLDFYMDRRPYKGVYFSQLHPSDSHEFEDFSVMLRVIEEDKVSEKDIVRMFLQSNRGVPQTPEHLDKVRAMYESMKG